MTSTPRRRRSLWRAAFGLAAVMGLAVLVLQIVQLAPIRRVVLGQVVSLLEDRAGIVLEADSLQYSLLEGRVVLSALSVAATRPETDRPFVEGAERNPHTAL